MERFQELNVWEELGFGEKDTEELQRGSFIESFPQTYFEGKWLQNRLGADKNESRSLLAVDIQGHQRGGFCVVPIAGR